MNVLSLFDGMSAGLQALKQAGIPVTNYYASEIDKYAIQVSAKNHPDIIRLGDVTKWREWDLPKIDLLIAGSPCQGFSSAGKGLNFEDPRSALFFEFVEILKEIKPRFFMLENVKMKKEWQDIISGLLGVEPVEINSALVSAQNRKRLYWANWEIGQPEDRGILLKDILVDGLALKEKSQTILATIYKENSKSMVKRGKQGLIAQIDRYYLSEEAKNHDRTMKNLRELGGKAKTITAFGWGFGGSGVNLIQDSVGYRKLTPTECERLQTFPDGYTEGVSNTQRYKMLGNGWTVAVIEHIFKSMPLNGL